ncbi:MAG TPA: nuclear transport factor 2 family protein [Gemmatimonadales bacterium]|jgi:ketosteroid isomerase-like protein
MRAACAALVVALALGGCHASQFTAGHRAAERDSVAQMLDAWRGALAARDFGRAATFYSSDSAFRWFQDGELKYRSARELADTMLAMAPVVRDFGMSLIEPEITPVAPGVAIVTTNFAEKITDTTGETIGLAGALSMTAVHGDSGWRFLIGHTSSVIVPADSGAPRKPPRS